MINKRQYELHSSTLKRIMKWLFLIGTSCYLAYKLIVFDDYPALLNSFTYISFNQILALTVAILLQPINLIIAARKWQLLISKTTLITTRQALNAVFAGFSTGFTTPNRLGEMVGRMLFTLPKHRKAIAFYALLNSFTQNLIIAVVGLPAILFFFRSQYATDHIKLQTQLVIITALAIVGIIGYLLLPKIIGKRTHTKLAFLSDIQLFRTAELLKICVYTLVRYLIFSTQLYFMLQFLNINLSIAHALISIPASYLVITLTPTVAFSEAGVRSSIAIFFIGAYCSNSAGIALASLMLWILNFGIPMLVGLKIIADTK